MYFNNIIIFVFKFLYKQEIFLQFVEVPIFKQMLPIRSICKNIKINDKAVQLNYVA